MVMPLSCSSSLESKYLTLPAIRCDMIPFVAKRESLKDVFPWSTCAKIQIFRTLAVELCKSRTFSGDNFMVVVSVVLSSQCDAHLLATHQGLTFTFFT